MAEDINVEIANVAIGFFGEDDQITSPDDDKKPARSVRAVWRSVRRFVRSKREWSCGKRRASLSARTANAEYPIIGFTHAFPLPSEFIKLCRILEPRDLRADYQIGAGPSGREIWMDHSGALEIEYIADVEEAARWSPEFTEAFTMRLAWQVADRLSGDKQRKQQALDAYEAALSEAGGSEARQQPPREHAETGWSRARIRGSDARAPNT